MDRTPDAARIVPAERSHAPGALEIYNESIATSIASFYTTPRPLAEMEATLLPPSGHPVYVAVDDRDRVLGFANSKQWSPRQAYERTVEVSIYLAEDAQGRGLGKALYKKLFADLRDRGYASIIAGVSLPNEASVRLHEGMGMRAVGVFKGVGEKFGKIIDVGYWQLELYRVSPYGS